MKIYKNLELSESYESTDIYEKSILAEEDLKNLKILVYQHLISHDPFKSRNATEIITEYILKNYHIRTIKDDVCSEMYLYQDGIYRPNAESFIKEICREILEKSYTSHFANEVIEKIKADTFIEEEEFRGQEATNIYQIPVENGILEITKKELYPFTANKTFLQKLPIKYDPKADCPKIKKFIHDITINNEDFIEIQELFGYLLLKEYRFEYAWMLCGNGRNGKGKLICIIKNFLGAHNCCNINLQTLDKDQYASGELYGKMSCIGADISNESLQETATFKLLTGRDMVSAPRKYKNRINFINYAKMIFSSNEMPATRDLTPAFFKRWRILDFPYTFYSKQEYALLEDKNNAKIANPNIAQEISTPEEMSGLLNFALDGLHNLLERNDFSKCRTTESIKNIWLRKSDSFDAFFKDCLELKENVTISKKSLKTHYVNYCNLLKLRVRADSHIKAYLENKGVIDKKDRSMAEEQHYWDGVNLSENASNLSKQSAFSLPYDQIPFFTIRYEKRGQPGQPGQKTLEIVEETL